jgi:acetyltransferase
MQQHLSLRVRTVPHGEFVPLVPVLSELLADAVNHGASLGFVPPMPYHEARAYLLSLHAELRAGSRLLLAACCQGRLVGSGQLVFPCWPTAQHRAELQKLVVDRALRGQGVGTLLMNALHDAAHGRGRSLIVLGTRHGEAPEQFYTRLGYQPAGVIPGYSVGPAGASYDVVSMYRHLSS